MLELVKFEDINGQNVLATTSLKIAEFFEKNHFDVIRGIEVEINKGLFDGSNFAVVEYKDKKGEMRKMYILDERFTTFLIMGFTGSKADVYKLKYIDEFARMRKELQESVKRVKGDPFAIADKAQKKLLDEKRMELDGKVGHIGLYCQVSRRTNELAFGRHEKGIRDNMSKRESDVLIDTFVDTLMVISSGVTNPTKMKESVIERRQRLSNKEVKKIQ